MKPLYFIMLVFFLQSCKGQPGDKPVYNNDDNTLLWEISGKGMSKPSYLFGTFHLMCKEDIHFSEPFKKAIKNAGEVYFEMDLDDPANTLGAIFFINMKDGKSLKDLFNEQQYKRLDAYFKDSLGMDLKMFNHLKPNLLEAMIYPKLMPCKTLSGLEEEIMKLARDEKKEIRGFETVQFQASVFDSIPYDKQANELLKAIDSLQEDKKSFDSLLTAYKNQQLSELEKVFTRSDHGLEENRDILLDNRNKNWVEQLKKILQEKNIFIAVGAGHLVGEKGLISLLRKAGYTVKPLMNR